MITIAKPSALDQMLFDIFVTALEGGIGYWSECSEYHWMDEVIHPEGHSSVVNEDIKGFFAVITNTVEDDPQYNGGTQRIDRKIIGRGYRLATGKFRDNQWWSTGKPPLVVGPETDWDFDASDADIIVQLGLFGDVIYG